MNFPSIEYISALIALISALSALLGGWVGTLLKKENRLTSIETKIDGLKESAKETDDKLDALKLNIDKIALIYLRTPKAIAEEEERQKEREKNKLSD